MASSPAPATTPQRECILPPRFRRRFSPMAKRFKAMHDAFEDNEGGSSWQPIDAESPRTRRMSRMSLSTYSSSPLASPTKSVTAAPSSPTVMPSSPMTSEMDFGYSRKRKASESFSSVVDELDHDGDFDDMGGLQLLLTAIDKKHRVASPASSLRTRATSIAEQIPSSSLLLGTPPRPLLISTYESPTWSPSPITNYLTSEDAKPAQLKITPKLPELRSSTPQAKIGSSLPSSPLSSITPTPRSATPQLPETDVSSDPVVPEEKLVVASPPKPKAPSPVKPANQNNDRSEIEGLVVTTLAFGSSTSLTAPAIARSIAAQAPHLVKPSSNILGESGNLATQPDDIIEPKRGGKGKQKAKGPKKSGKKAKEERLQELTATVERILQEGQMFGQVDRDGEDAAGEPLLPIYFYDVDHDQDEERAMTVKACGGRSKRRATKRNVQYYYAPVSLNRFEVAAEEDD